MLKSFLQHTSLCKSYWQHNTRRFSLQHTCVAQSLCLYQQPYMCVYPTDLWATGKNSRFREPCLCWQSFLLDDFGLFFSKRQNSRAPNCDAWVALKSRTRVLYAPHSLCTLLPVFRVLPTSPRENVGIRHCQRPGIFGRCSCRIIQPMARFIASKLRFWQLFLIQSVRPYNELMINSFSYGNTEKHYFIKENVIFPILFLHQTANWIFIYDWNLCWRKIFSRR